MPPTNPSDCTLLPTTIPPGVHPLVSRQYISLPDSPLIFMAHSSVPCCDGQHTGNQRGGQEILKAGQGKGRAGGEEDLRRDIPALRPSGHFCAGPGHEARPETAGSVIA